MALDEYLYGKIANYFKKRSKQASIEEQARICHLEDIKPRLLILARAITGKAIEIFPAEREGGYKNENFFLPTSISFFEQYDQNLSLYFFRILYLSVQQSLNINWDEQDDLPLSIAQKNAAESSDKILKKLSEEYPIGIELHELFLKQFRENTKDNNAIDTTWLYGKWMRNDLKNEYNQPLNNFSENIKKAKEQEVKTILKAKAVEEIISVEIDKKAQEDYVMTHNFEKVETADEHSGIWRDFDGEDELEDHQDALDELNMKYVVRVDDSAHSIYQAEFTEHTNISESGEQNKDDYHICYDEWHHVKGEYKKDFCKVYPTNNTKYAPEYYLKTIKEHAIVLNGLRKMLTSINNRLQQQRRQTDGDEFEIDALCDLYTEIYSGKSPDENIYLSRRKKEKDISILLLLDLSLSSDGYADGNRVIDVEKQVSILFGEILNEYKIDFAVQGFYSKTRNYASYINLKGFDDKWDKAKMNIGAVEPNGYTRIGAALRHSGSLLQQRKTKNKWVILLSDGKPNDYDKYEGSYGIQDVKKALQELKGIEIQSYALAIEAQAKYYLPQMFGQNHYQILTTPTELLSSLVGLYEKIKR